jgi:hypothetical protein
MASPRASTIDATGESISNQQEGGEMRAIQSDWGKKEGYEPTLCYEKKDLENFYLAFVTAEKIWNKEWESLGRKQEGCCCVGKGITVQYVRPRGRTAIYNYRVVPCPPTQGNISAQESVGPALEFLEKKGVKCRYFDGYMN